MSALRAFAFLAALALGHAESVFRHYYTQPNNAQVVLTGEEQAPNTGAQALFHMQINEETNQADYLMFHNVQNPTTCRMYAPAVSGIETEDPDGIHTLSTDCKSPVQGSIALTGFDRRYIHKGWAYIEIDSATFPSGEVRGQISHMSGASTGSAYTHVTYMSTDGAQALWLTDFTGGTSAGYQLWHNLPSPTQHTLDNSDGVTLVTIGDGGSSQLTDTKVLSGSINLAGIADEIVDQNFLAGEYKLSVASVTLESTKKMSGSVKQMAGYYSDRRPNFYAVGDYDEVTHQFQHMIMHSATDATSAYLRRGSDNVVVLGTNPGNPYRSTATLTTSLMSGGLQSEDLDLVLETTSATYAADVNVYGGSSSEEGLSAEETAGVAIAAVAVVSVAGAGAFVYARRRGITLASIKEKLMP